MSRYRLITVLVLTLFLGACASVDKHVFDSTPHLPTTVELMDTTNDTVFWKMDIPVWCRLKLDFDRAGEHEYFGVNETFPRTYLHWTVHQQDSRAVIKEGVENLCGLPFLIKVSYRDPPEMPEVLPDNCLQLGTNVDLAADPAMQDLADYDVDSVGNIIFEQGQPSAAAAAPAFNNTQTVTLGSPAAPQQNYQPQPYQQSYQPQQPAQYQQQYAQPPQQQTYQPQPQQQGYQPYPPQSNAQPQPQPQAQPLSQWQSVDQSAYQPYQPSVSQSQPQAQAQWSQPPAPQPVAQPQPAVAAIQPIRTPRYQQPTVAAPQPVAPTRPMAALNATPAPVAKAAPTPTPVAAMATPAPAPAPRPQVNAAPDFSMSSIARSSQPIQAADGRRNLPLQIRSELLEQYDPSVVSILVEGVPLKATLSAGHNNGSGIWTLRGDQINNLTMAVPSDVNQDVQLMIIATAPKPDGDTASSVTTLAVKVGSMAAVR